MLNVREGFVGRYKQKEHSSLKVLEGASRMFSSFVRVSYVPTWNTHTIMQPANVPVTLYVRCFRVSVGTDRKRNVACSLIRIRKDMK